MRNPANVKLRTIAAMGLLLLGAGARFAAAQTPVPQALNDLRKQVNPDAQTAPAAPQAKPSSPATSTSAKPPLSSSASTANKAAQPKPSNAPAQQAQTKTASGTAAPQTKPLAPAASTAAKPPVSAPASAANKPGQTKPSNPPAPQAQAKTADAKVQAVKPGAVPAAATAQAKPDAQPPVKVVNVKSGTAESSSKAQPSAATTQTVSAPAAQAKAVPAVAEVPEASHVARRDPFDPLVGKVRETAGGPQAPLPAGKPGLVVATLRIDGIVKGTNGMIAIASNPQMRVYFLREGDHLYDGAVEHITMEGVSFHETGKDAFGKSVEREVTKRLYPTPGEQQ